MRASAIFSVLFGATAAFANFQGNHTQEWTTTEIVTQYTTYCPFPTTVVENNHTYTVTEATTLTITDCPCTLTKTYTTVTETICPGGCQPPPTPSPPTPTSVCPGPGPCPPPVETETPIYVNTTTYVAPEPTYVAPNVTVAPTPPPFTGAAVSNNKVTLAGGALAALVGVAAYLL